MTLHVSMVGTLVGMVKYGEYPCLHCFCVTDKAHSKPGGPDFHEGHGTLLQSPKLTSEQYKELADTIHKELALKARQDVTHTLLNSYLKSKGTPIPRQALDQN